MKKYIIVIMAVLIVVTSLTGCMNNKKVAFEDVISNTSTSPENDNKSDSNILNETSLEVQNKDSVIIDEEADDLKHKKEFLDSKEGHDFQVASWKFTKAYLSGDVSTVKNYLIDTENKGHHYNIKNIFNDVEFLILKLDPKDIKEDKVIAEYEFSIKGQDYYQYLNLEMKMINGEWKVEFYGMQM